MAKAAKAAISKSALKDELIDGRVSAVQCKKAVVALTEHAQKVAKQREESELLGGKEENVWLVLTVKRSHPEKKLKPQRIPLRYTLVDPRTTPICLITKDPQREYKDLLESHGIKFISRVVGIEKLKGKFKPFEARRMLLKENGMFLADERVVPLLPGLLGKKFFEAKKQPIPVSLTKKELKTELELAVSSSYMHQNQGTCTSIKIGTISHTPAQILENLKTALPVVVKKVRGGWDNVQSFNIKTNSSVSLPIWACGLGEDRWGEMETEGVEAEEAADESMDVEVKKAPVEKSTKGKKREAEGEESTPKKKKAKKGDAVNAPAPTESESAMAKPSSTESPLVTPPAPNVEVNASTAPPKKEGKKRRRSTNVAEAVGATASAEAELSSSKKTKASEVTPIPTPAAAPLTGATVQTEAPTPEKKKKRKEKRKLAAASAAIAEAIVPAPAFSPPPVVTELPTVMTPSETQSETPVQLPEKKMKKKTKRRLEEAAAAAAAALESANVPTVAVNTPTQPEPTPVAETSTEPTKPKKTRKAKASPAVTSTAPAAEPVVNPATELSSPGKSAPSAALTTSEIKGKRSGEGMEKKKAKVTKAAGKTGKAKEGLVGKKVKAVV